MQENGRRISGLKNHYIVCGYGRMGKIICNELSKRNQKFVVVDNRNSKFEAVTEEGYIVLEGDCLDDNVLNKANIKKARGLVAVLKKDEDNLFVTLSARDTNPDLFVISKNSYEYNRKKFFTAGADKVLNPYEIAGHSLENMLTRPAVVDFLEIISQGMEVDLETDVIIVEDNSKIIGQEIRQAFDREELDIIIAAIQKPDWKMKFNPRGRTIVEPGDKLIAMGYLENLKVLEDYCRELQAAE